MSKFLSLIIASYFLTAPNASAVDTISHPDCILNISGKLWRSTRSKYEDARMALIAKGYTLTEEQSGISIRQIGRQQFQLQRNSWQCGGSSSSSDETMLVLWEGQLQNAPACVIPSPCVAVIPCPPVQVAKSAPTCMQQAQNICQDQQF